MWMLPLAYGGPSCSTNFGAPLRRARICPYRSWAAQRASVSGSLVCRPAFIGNSVRGRLTVSFHSGMGIPRFYNDPMLRRATLDNGLKVLVQEEHTAPLASVWCWYKVGSKDERPGLTGVSHWVEHMNFKGTTNIPRDQVKGIIEQFGGSWNGYTWIDQTTYLETATKDALDRMLFIESERMANCLYHPDDCESERTVIISELHGGENDPDQFLDQEVVADRVQGAPVPPPDDRLALRSGDDDPRRSVRLLPALLRPQQRDAGRRRRRGHRRGAAPASSSTSAGSRRATIAAAPADRRAGADRRAARDDSQSRARRRT